MMWCYRVHSSTSLWDCGATLKHPGLFECEDISLNIRTTCPTTRYLIPAYLYLCILHDLQQNYFLVVTYAQEEIIQWKHGSLGPHDTLFCSRTESTTELQFEQTS